MSKRIFSLILAAVMVFSLLPAFASAEGENPAQVAAAKSYSDPGWTKSGGMATRKTLTPDENGNYTITMEAYAEGEVISQKLETGYPLDIAIVVDQSGSMKYGTNLTEQNGPDSTYGWSYSNLPTDQQVLFKDGDNYYEVYKGTYYDRNDNLTYALYYDDSNGTQHQLYTNNNYYGNSSSGFYDCYKGTLYVTSGTSRYLALQQAVTDFCQTVADKAELYGTEHKIALIGFAGNQQASTSVSNGVYHYSGDNRNWDYVNTGLFVGNQFVNYKTITSYESRTYSDNYYTNNHYFLYSNSRGYYPIAYDESVNRWYDVANSDTYVTPASGTKMGNPGYNANGYSRTYYEAVYTTLEDYKASGQNYYQQALVTASTGRNGTNTDGTPKGTVNNSLTQSIENIGCYGGTYTSYGIAMANQVFANNTAQRNMVVKDEDGNVISTQAVTPMKVIILFTDGEPGGRGYEASIAGEALADATIAKQNYGAQIYALGLFAGTPSDDVNAFMSNVSSEAYTTKQNVSWADLDGSKTYYYTDTNENKTYSVSCDGNLHLIEEFALEDGYSYSHYTPIRNGSYWKLTSSSGNDSCAVYQLKSGAEGNHIADYEKATSLVRGNTYYYREAYDSSNKTYYFSDSGTYFTAVTYDYYWMNSDGRVRRSLDANHSQENAAYRQFFTINTLSSGEDTEYYFTVQDAYGLTERFNAIASEIQAPVSMTTIDSTNSFLRDIITADFDVDTSSISNVSVSIERGHVASDGADPTWTAVTDQNKTADETAMLGALTPSWESGKSLKVTGFDYGTNYVGYEHDGYKLVVTITGLKPNQSGTIYSNTAASGICKVEEDESSSVVAPFTNPYITIDEEYKVLDFSAKSLLSESAFNYNEKSEDEHGGSFAYESAAHNLFFTPAFAFGTDGKANISAFSKTSSALYFSKAAESVWKKVNVVPANNVYFDDDLTAQQNTLSRGDNGYGYLSDTLTVSVNGVTQVTKTDNVNTREITFHGKRLDVYFQSDNTVNNVSVTLKDAEGNATMGTINGNQNASRLDSVIVHKTTNQTMVNVPVISVVFDEVNTYTVVLSAKTANGFRIDGVRVYGAADETDETVNAAYTADEELNANFTRVRELLLSAEKFNSITDNSPVSGAVFVDLAEGKPTIADYTKDGPKNEVYLSAGQGVAFNVEGYESKNISIGLRSAESGVPANAEVSNGTGKNTYSSLKSIDMYYSLAPDASGNVYIKNTSGGILAVTNIKVTDAAPTVGEQSKKVEFFATAKTMSYVRSFDELENVTVEPSPEPIVEPTTEPTEQPSIVDWIRQIVSDFVARLFSSIGRLFGH